jgi:hypothetical protein
MHKSEHWQTSLTFGFVVYRAPNQPHVELLSLINMKYADEIFDFDHGSLKPAGGEGNTTLKLAPDTKNLNKLFKHFVNSPYSSHSITKGLKNSSLSRSRG